MTKTSSPVLWFGDLVDFGSFHGAVSDNNVQKTITFIFALDDLRFPPDVRSYSAEPQRNLKIELEVDIGVLKYPAVQAAPNEQTHIAAFRILNVTDGVLYDARLNDSNELFSLTINGLSALEYFSDYDLKLFQGTVFPELLLRPKDPGSPPQNRVYLRDHLVLLDAMGRALRPFLHGSTKQDTLDRYATALLMLPTFDKETLLKLSNDIQAAQYFKGLLSDAATNDARSMFDTLHRIYHANRLIQILNRLSGHLRDVLANTLYIGPARVRSERYYRYQDLAVSEIDPNGTNFPMFLNSLGPHRLAELSNWVQDLFNYRIEIKSSEGHLSINLLEGSYSTNIVDTGYGVSQILPVLGQIWWAARRPRLSDNRLRRRERLSILAIEQPELHLHPAHQALLADAISGHAKDFPSGEPLHFVVETHSETFVNRLGELIADKKLDPENVQILVFDARDEDARVTAVEIARFGNDGELINWPYGFFQAAQQ
ncbi:UNVERIFIED_ORG: hypothetical protein M2193_000456 [Bradyrhizobium japonicum]|uniref:AAA family ATPase n=1 Tax=Bradyrhizobium TaxID=374 RepID=UPI0035D4CE56